MINETYWVMVDVDADGANSWRLFNDTVRGYDNKCSCKNQTSTSLSKILDFPKK